MKKTPIWIGVGLVLAAALVVGIAPAAAQGGSALWAAAYYANPWLVGPPVLSQMESSPTHNWGSGSPGSGLPVDNFSARWSSIQNLAAGRYRLSVRADDGVRVFVDGVLRVDEWHESPFTLYTAEFNLSDGQHAFLVQYFERGGDAALEFNLTSLTAAPPPVSGASATVTASVLNVRATPDPINGQVLTRIFGGQSYPMVGRNADSSWVQLNVNGVFGWVNRSFVVTTDLQNVPIVGVSSQTATGVTATVTAFNLNVRDAPNPFTGNILTRVRQGEMYPVIGRNADGSWIQINVNGLVGWVNRSFTVTPNVQSLPVTSNTTPPTGASATVTAFFLNVRNIPNPFTGTVLTTIARGQTYNVIGRNADSSWVQLDVNGIRGWVNRSFVQVTNLGNVPVTG